MDHQGCPVLYGNKWIANKWIRWTEQVDYFPFFGYDIKRHSNFSLIHEKLSSLPVLGDIDAISFNINVSLTLERVKTLARMVCGQKKPLRDR